MEIFFTASFTGKKKYQNTYDLVIKTLEATGATIFSPEKGNYLDILTKKEIKELKTPNLKHYLAIKKGIAYADAVVLEVSNEDFQLGHEATLAIQNSKHVLCLSVHEDFSEKIRNKYFHGAKYDEYCLEEIIEAFIKKVEGVRLDRRFNMFLSEKQYKILEEMAEGKGITMSEALRGMIDHMDV